MQDALRGDVERIGWPDEFRQLAAQQLGGRGRGRRQIEPERLTLIERHALDRARIGEDREPLGRRRRKPYQELGHVDQFLEALDHHRAGMRRQRHDHRVIPGERAGMRLRRGARRRAAAGMEQHDRLAQRAGARGQGKEALRPADLLGEGGDNAGFVVLDDVFEIVLERQHRLVAGRDGVAHAEPAGPERVAQDGREPAALGDDGDRRRRRLRRHRLRREGERHAVDIVHEAEAIRAAEREPALVRRRREAFLRLRPFPAGLAEPRREDDCGADPAAGAGRHRLFDGRRAAPSASRDRRLPAARRSTERKGGRDFGAIAADEVDRDRKPNAPDCRAARSRASPAPAQSRHGDRARPEQPRDVDRPLTHRGAWGRAPAGTIFSSRNCFSPFAAAPSGRDSVPGGPSPSSTRPTPPMPCHCTWRTACFAARSTAGFLPSNIFASSRVRSLQPRARHGFVDEAHRCRLLAVEGLAGHDVIHARRAGSSSRRASA